MDIYTALHKDHEEIKPLLARLEAATELNADTTQLLATIRDLLIPHSRAEEEVFYNSIRRADPDNEVAMHGFREHMEAEALLRTLQGAAMIGVEWTAAARKLREAVSHHIVEEETTIFSAAKRLFDSEEAEQIGSAFLALKPQAREEGMLGSAMHMVSNLMPPRFRGTDPAQQRHA